MLPGQNGADPHSYSLAYGFRAKSIVRIQFTDKQPHNTWAVRRQTNTLFASESDGRSPALEPGTERRMGAHRRKTLMFNGYGEQVASPTAWT